MTAIKLELQNRTNLDLTFFYDESRFEIPARGSRVYTVEEGHQVSVFAPRNAKAKGHYVESDLFVSTLERDIALKCELIAWQLQLRMSVPLV